MELEPTEALRLGRAALRGMVARWPEFDEHVFRALPTRRARDEEGGHGVPSTTPRRGATSGRDVIVGGRPRRGR